MAHLSRHKQIASKNKATAVSFLPTVKTYVSSNLNQGLKFKCGCCSESFPTKESLAIHMQQHTVTQAKPKSSCIIPPIVTKSTNDSSSSVLEIKSEPVVQTTSLFEDIEELSHQEPQPQAPGSVGVCTEEQKGRVCLLALLNNGVCSDLSHRAPAAGPGQISPQNSSVSAGEQTISITVSIPSCVNGGQMTEQQLSIPAVSQHSNSTCLSYPVTFANSPVTSTLGLNSLSVINTQSNKLQENILNSSNQRFNLNHTSSLQNNCLDLPDLCDSFPISKLGSKGVENSQELVLKDRGNETSSKWSVDKSIENVTNNMSNSTSMMSSSGLVQSMDMPCLLEEEMLPKEDSIQESFGMTSGKVHTFKSDLSVAPNKVGKNTEIQGMTNAIVHPDLTESSNKNGTGSVQNIAIVSVKSVQMNKESYEENNSVIDWFYASSGKEISPVIEGQRASDLESPAEASWFSESDQMSVSDKLLNEKCNAAGYSISTDACIVSHKITTEGSKKL